MTDDPYQSPKADDELPKAPGAKAERKDDPRRPDERWVGAGCLMILSLPVLLFLIALFGADRDDTRGGKQPLTLWH